MSEIRSTMEMVLERAARMSANATTEDSSEEYIREGMRLAAAFMRGEGAGLGAGLAEAPQEQRRAIRLGAVRGLLRNIFLARDSEKLAAAEKAMHGLVEIGQGEGRLLEVLGEAKKILDGYRQHREQIKKQLEAQFAQQMEMMEKNLARQTGLAMKIQPEQHPKFQEEWARIQTQLDDQYGRALGQMKDMIEQQLTADH